MPGDWGRTVMATKPGERKLQILQVLAEMLQDPKGERVTTAALAAKLDVSEAALYRHFASKAQMFEGLIEFIESSLFGLINKITSEEPNGLQRVHGILSMLLGFAEKNPGMTRVLIGDALVNEDSRLQARINLLHDKLEATLKQCLRVAATQAVESGGAAAEDESTPRANALLCYVIGRWHQFAKSGFKRPPTAGFEKQAPLLI
jgi:TetR/AcrR family transcriptional regulator